MQKLAIIIINLMVSTVAFASWYWPFGGEEATDEKHEKRLSELMEPASLLIDEAMDLVEDGNAQAAKNIFVVVPSNVGISDANMDSSESSFDQGEFNNSDEF